MKHTITDQEVIGLLKDGRYSVCPDTGEVRPRGRNKPLSVFRASKQDRTFVRLYIGKRRRRGIVISKLVWMSVTLEVVPTGWEVHHRDFDRTNNAWSNLVCLHKLDHRKYHNGYSDEEPIPE